MLATWLNEQAVTAYQLIKSESKEFTSEVVYKLAAVSLIVCLRVLTMVCSLKPSTATLHTSSGKFTHHWGKPEQNVLFFQFWKWLLKHTNLPLRINEVFLILILINTKKKCTKCKCNPPTVSQIYRPSGYKTHVNARWKESDPVSTVSQRHKDSQSVNNEEMQRWMKGWMKKY